MIKKRLFVVLLFFFISLGSLSFSNAIVEYNRNSIEKNYQAGESIRGKVNLNLTDENTGSIISSNLVGSISLIELIRQSNLEEGEDYTCTILGCNKVYRTENSISSFSLNEEKIIGFKLSGSDVEVESLKFNFVGDLSSSCTPPAFIDLLNDNSILLTSNYSTGEKCYQREYGCFDRNLENSEYNDDAVITDERICEQINLSAGAGYFIGARIKNRTIGEKGVLIMELLDNEFESLGECLLSEHIQSEQDLECYIDYISGNTNEYWICVYNSEYIDGDYRIRSEKKGNVCGTANEDFEIFAQPAKFGNVNIQFNADDSEEDVDRIADYLFDNFVASENNKINCEDDCIIPIRIFGQPQNFVLNNIDLRYRNNGIARVSNSIFELSAEESKINGEKIELDLEKANLFIPISSTPRIFSLRIGNRTIFSANISVKESFDFDISPKFALIGVNTLFEIDDEINVTKSTWKFGNDSEIETNSKSISKIIERAGELDLIVMVEKSDGTSSKKTFKIISGKPKESAEFLIASHRGRIVNISEEIGKYENWIVNEIKKKIDVVSLKNSIDRIALEFKNETSDEKYIELIQNILELKVPYEISPIESGELPIEIGFDSIDIRYAEEISKKESENPSETKKGIIQWVQRYYVPIIEFKKISSFGDSGRKDLFSVFKIELNRIETSAVQDYLIINYPLDAIIFKRDYSADSIGGSGTMIPLNSEIRDIDILIEEDIDASELGVYITPSLENIFADSESITFEEEREFDYAFFIKMMLILIFAFLIVYVILQEWYKRKYEKYLFPNPNDLYNLVNFVYNARAAGLYDEKIRRKLKDAGWTAEKINYAMRKIDGRRTGMWEIPIFKFIENKRVKQELERRQKTAINTKFIKRPEYIRP